MATRPPNIIWIFCDELRTDALGCYGHARLSLPTPNLDRLAATGVRYTQHFCNSPVCVSSRVATLTSKSPEETGVYNNEGAWKHFKLPAMHETFPQAFARQGYRTANFGKIHLARGMNPGETPGYDIFQHHQGDGGGMNFWQGVGEDTVQMIRAPNGGMNGGIWPEGQPYPPDQVTANALQWLSTVEGPYLARLSILQPHTPVLPLARHVQQLAALDPGVPVVPLASLSAFERRVAEVHGLDRMDPEKFRTARLHYYAQVLWIDEQVGQVLDFLEARGEREQTIIVFGADHGNPIGDTGAFEKHTFTPTVHRVPLLISWPGTLPAGEVRAEVCDSLDLGPTLLGLAGLAIPEGFRGRQLFHDPAPGVSYSTIGFGQKDSRMGPNGGRGEWYGGRGWPRRSCIRTQQFRLDKNMLLDCAKPAPEDEDIFLADTLADPQEFTNLAHDPAYADTVRQLGGLLDRHAEGAIEIAHEYLRR
jgi:choline-sulfatase